MCFFLGSKTRLHLFVYLLQKLYVGLSVGSPMIVWLLLERMKLMWNWVTQLRDIRCRLNGNLHQHLAVKTALVDLCITDCHICHDS